jgi:hypothetical protein
MNAPQTPAPAGREVGRKITISTVTGGPKKWFDALIAIPAGENGVRPDMELMKVYGIANGGTAGATDLGEFYKIMGNFRAVNLRTGEVTEAPQVILPTFLGQAMAAALAAPDRAGPIQFAFQIAARFDAAAAQKFVYVIRDLLPPAVNDPLAALEQKMGLALPAPAAADALPGASGDTEAPAPAPAPAAAPAPAGKRK